MKKLKPILAIVLALTSAYLGTGCSSNKVNESDPKSMYEDAQKDVKNDRYLLALDKLRIVKSKFSYTSYGALAQLLIGDVYFLQESYPEAAAAYESFVELYPRNDKAAYALFRAGESHYKDIPTKTDRDLRSAESTISTMNNYIRKYPTGEFLPRANEMKTFAYNKLAEKELNIAEFYLHRKKTDAARLRLQKLLDQYGDSSSAEKAKEMLRKL